MTFIFTAKGQTTATNFTATDCNGVQHELFTELDAGHVVVIVWVMPCSSCLGPALTAYNIVQTYAATYPGKVLYYLCDDYANTTCSIVNGWANTGGIGANRTTFSDASILMSDYGSAGMPKIVVLGGYNHQVFFNEVNAAAGNPTLLQNAINSAITASGINEHNGENPEITLSPNPAYYQLNVSFKLNNSSDVEFQILNINGAVAKKYDKIKNQSGVVSYQLKVNNLPEGNYILKATIGDKVTFSRFSIVN